MTSLDKSHGNAVVKDPVCGMTVDPAKAAASSEYRAMTYFFCSAGCKKKFDSAPDMYLSPSQIAEQPAIAGSARATEYTCPMHPEIARDKPGECPLCGMALEPVTVSAPITHLNTHVPCTRRSCAISRGIALSVG